MVPLLLTKLICNWPRVLVKLAITCPPNNKVPLELLIATPAIVPKENTSLTLAPPLLAIVKAVPP